MAVSWLLWLLAAAVLVSVVLLAAVCLHCRHRGPLVSIRQGSASEDYMPSTQFRVAHPSLMITDVNSIHLPSNLLPPYSSSAGPGSFITETESNPSYENPADGADYINTESDADDPGYIIVLPEVETLPTNQSRASTPSSDVLHDYENVPEKREEKDYLNVETLHFQTGSTPDLSAQSDSDEEEEQEEQEEEEQEEEEEDSSDDDEANYVNIQDGVQTAGPQ